MRDGAKTLANVRATDVGRLADLYDTAEVQETLQLATMLADASGDSDMAARLRRARAIVNERLGIRGD